MVAMQHVVATVAFLAMLAGGCVAARDPNAPRASPDEDRVRIRAARDLDCAQSDIAVTQQAAKRFVATGCGSAQTYRISCTSTSLHPSEHCSAMPVNPSDSSGDE